MNQKFRNYLAFKLRHISKSKPLRWENYYSNSPIFENPNSSKSIFEEERELIKKVTAKGIEKHLYSHLISSYRENGKYYRSFILNFQYDLFLASILNMKFNRDFLTSKSFNDNLNWRHCNRELINESDFEFLQLEEERKDKFILNLFLTPEMMTLRTLSNIIGLRNDNLKDLDKNISLPYSKYLIHEEDSSQEIIGCDIIPLITAPIFINSANYFDFFRYTNANFFGNVEKMDSFKDWYKSKRTQYWHKLTGEVNPQTQTIKEALVKVEDFSKLLSK